MFSNKNLFILVLAQVFSFSAGPVTVFISGIIGLHLSPIELLATLPTSLTIVGTAIFSIIASRIMAKIGRKLTFILSSVASSLAALLASFAIFQEMFVLYCATCLLIGAGIAVTHQYRFAAAEEAAEGKSANAISILLLAGILSAFIGPNIVNFAKNLTETLYVGSYIALSSVLIIPTLLFLFYTTNAAQVSLQAKSKQSYYQLLKNPFILQAIVTSAFAYAIMSFLMTATPISMHKIHGFHLGQTGIVIQFHVVGMFLPSLITGKLINRFGHDLMIKLGCSIYLLTVILSFFDQTFINYFIALILLGIGWNFLFITGTDLLFKSHQPEDKFKAQGMNDFITFTIQASASFLAGYSVLNISWNTLNILSIPMILIIYFVSAYGNSKRKNSLKSV